jgi:hypothetical protein
MQTKLFLLRALLLLFSLDSQSQVANLVNNGSFEQLDSCIQFPLTAKSTFWYGIDTLDQTYEVFNTCKGNIPGNSSAGNHQFAKTGNSFIGGTFFCANCLSTVRYTYIRNKLQSSLTANKVYCVKFFVNIRNYSTVGIDAIGLYFANNSVDTIKYGYIPISYLQPQITNPQNNIITDTLNWIPITGTFVAVGDEKNLIIGCFKDFGSVNYQQIGNWYPGLFCDILIDDVSCIEMNVAAYAGPDKWIIPGDSVYIGRKSDFAIDPYCYWFKFPSITTAIDTSSGIWVKPSSTSTYVVKQELECNSVKFDTVVVYLNPLGIEQLKSLEKNLLLYPQPANAEIIIKANGYALNESFSDQNLKVMFEEKINNSQDGIKINISTLPPGLYTLRLIQDKRSWSVGKRFVVE